MRQEVLSEPFDELLYFRSRPHAPLPTGASRRSQGAGSRQRRSSAPKDAASRSNPTGLLERACAGGGCNKDTLVELLGSYSKSFGQRQRIARISALTSPDAPVRPVRSPHHVHKAVQRLGAARVDELVALYGAGMPSTELMVRFGLGKGTVLDLLHDRGVAVRCQGLAPSDVTAAAELYSSGASLAQVGERFSCDAETVRTTLREAGVRIRTPWERGSGG